MSESFPKPLRRKVLVVIALSLIACLDQPASTAPDLTGIQRGSVTGPAAQALDVDGRFILEAEKAWTRRELTASEAQAIAEVFVRRIASTLPSHFERHRGAAIDFATLRPCERPMYAQTPYEEPPEGTPQGIVNAISSQWFHLFCDVSGSPALAVWVAASATHLRIVDGVLDTRSRHGMEFDGVGVPLGTTVPILPERAAEMLAVESGVRVRTVPKLVLAGIPFSPSTARWQMDLETAHESENAAGHRWSQRTHAVGLSPEGWQVRIFRPVSGVEQPIDIVRIGADELAFRRKQGATQRWETIEFAGGQR